MNNLLISWSLIFLAAFCDSYASYVVKLKFNEHGDIPLSSIRDSISYILVLLKSPLFISAIVTFVSAPALWFVALNRIDLSIGYPVLVVFHLIFVLLAGHFLLQESFSLNKLIGSVFIIISLYFFYKK